MTRLCPFPDYAYLMDPEEILRTALRLGFLTDAKAAECRRLIADSTTPAEALARAGRLTREQVRACLVLARADRARRDDEALGDFIARNKFLAHDVVAGCLAESEEPHLRGEASPRLADMLVERGHLTAQQLQVILRARAQLDSMRLQMQTAAPSPAPEAPPHGASNPGTDTKKRRRFIAEEALGNLTIDLRKQKVKDGRGEMTVFVLGIGGDLDAAGSRRLADYLVRLIDDGSTRIAIDCERLDSLSSAAVEVLAQAADRCRSARGDLRLCNLNDKAKRALNGAGVASPLRTYDGERGVVMSFKYQ